MASTTDFVPAGPRPRRRLAVTADRSRAFRRAARHTIAVRMLRLLLPVLSLALLAYYGLALKLTMGVAGVSLPAMPTITAEDLKMQNPRYEGFNKDGSRFLVTANSAEQQLMNRSAPIRLAGIEGEIVGADKAVTRLKARSGTFDTRTNALELFGGIDIAGDNGLRAVLTRAHVLTREATVTSNEPVMVEMPAGTIRGNALHLRQKERQATFSAGVSARLNPAAAPAGAPRATDKPRTGDAIGRRDLPVDVTSTELTVDDVAKTAVFRGAVEARQGESSLRSEELAIAYTGGGALPGTQPAAADAAPGTAPGTLPEKKTPQSKVSLIESRTPVILTQGQDRVTAAEARFDVEAERARLAGSVVMTSGADRRATADVAELDQKSDTILLTGSVHLTQGKNELRGARMWLDRKSGRSNVTTPGGRIWARFVPPDDARGGKRPAAASPAAPSAVKGLLGMGEFRANPDAPVVVDAERLDVDDRAHRAVFRGDVQASQDTVNVRAAELTAVLSGPIGLAAAPAEAARAGRTQAQIQRIEARKNVVVTARDGQKATGEWANFDVKTNTIVLGGNVVVSEGKQSARGSKLVINLTTGQYDLQGNPEQNVFTQSGGGRPSATFFPDRFRGKNKKETPPDAGATPAAAPAPGTAAPAAKPFQFDR